MAYGDYYNPANKVVNSGDIVYADDLNSINTAVDAGFAQVATDLDTIALGDANVSKAWATNDRGIRPDVLVDAYSSKANALEAKDWATGAGLITEASTGLTLAGSKSAKVYASEASSSASSASGFASTATTQAGTATTQAGIATTQAGLASGYKDTATTQAGIATTKATEAQDWASKAVDVIVSGGLYSARHYATKASDTVASLEASVNSLTALTPAADKIPYYTGASTAALATFTAAGRALLDDVDATAQRVTLGLGNVPNLDCTNGNNITSGTIADARIASTITRDNEIGSAVQTALDLKANLSSPTFTGTPTLTNTPTTSDNSNQLASTAFVVGQRGVNNPLADGVVAVGTSYLYAREDHRHPQDASKADVLNPTFSGNVALPATTSIGLVDSDELSYLNGVSSPIQTQLSFKSGFKNKLINGDFNIWQRGAPIVIPSGSSAFLADRWIGTSTGSSLSVSRASYSGSSSSDGLYGLSIAGASGNTSCNISQRIESLITAPLAGRTMTLSGIVYRSSGSTIDWEVKYANGVDNFTSTTLISSGTLSVTSGGTSTFSASFTMPSSYSDRGIEITIKFGALTSGSVSLKRMRLEEGGSLSTYEARSPQEESLLCKRYFNKLPSDYCAYTGYIQYGCIFYANFQMPEMRVTPMSSSLTPGASLYMDVNSITPLSPSHVRFQATATATTAVGFAYGGCSLSAEL